MFGVPGDGIGSIGHEWFDLETPLLPKYLGLAHGDIISSASYVTHLFERQPQWLTSVRKKVSMATWVREAASRSCGCANTGHSFNIDNPSRRKRLSLS
jgi:hypothetical protein